MCVISRDVKIPHVARILAGNAPNGDPKGNSPRGMRMGCKISPRQWQGPERGISDPVSEEIENGKSVGNGEYAENGDGEENSPVAGSEMRTGRDFESGDGEQEGIPAPPRPAPSH
ncbi:hypothetical protein PIB30_047550 [Stylosanthes scabra]|uniref:Uncharacterized protein n=1 Tax=Stylosanthes scabra TaxID=79078 RepID=A0ABU6TH54_9FABA|nr:hypothetical protein [Stylosanthes scabra]